MESHQGIFFDLHGTLLISNNIDGAWSKWANAFHLAMKEKGADITFDEFEKYLNGMFEDKEPQYSEPGFTLFMRRVKQLGLDLGLDIPSDEIRPLVDSIIRIWHDGMYLDSEVFPVLTELRKQYPVGLITNWEHTPRIYELVNELGLSPYLDVITVSDEVGYAKPDPRIFTSALNAVGASAEASYYVGDMDLDVEGALNAGLKPILIKRPEANGEWYQYTSEKDCNYKPEDVIIVKRLSDILGILRNQ